MCTGCDRSDNHKYSLVVTCIFHTYNSIILTVKLPLSMYIHLLTIICTFHYIIGVNKVRKLSSSILVLSTYTFLKNTTSSIFNSSHIHKSEDLAGHSCSMPQNLIEHFVCFFSCDKGSFEVNLEKKLTVIMCNW